MIFRNIEKLDKHVEDGYILKKKHPTDDLWIYNYTQKAQYEGLWDDVTMICRGLILDGENNIVAKPFKKFFNIEERLLTPTEKDKEFRNFKVYNKFDGSLGISYIDSNGDVCIATRGSFTSEQAVWATKEIQKKSELCKFIKEYDDMTFLFEIIYDENRIVVNYDDEELVLIAANEKDSDACMLETVKHFIPDEISISECHVEGFGSLEDKMFKSLKMEDIANKEGYVVRFSCGDIVKIKFENYIIKHKLYTGISERSIWECLMNGETKEEIVSILPDELYEWANEKCDDILYGYGILEMLSLDAFQKYEKEYGVGYGVEHRKHFAAWACEPEQAALKGMLFRLLDGREISDMIWKCIKPENTKSYFQENK